MTLTDFPSYEGCWTKMGFSLKETMTLSLWDWSPPEQVMSSIKEAPREAARVLRKETSLMLPGLCLGATGMEGCQGGETCWAPWRVCGTTTGKREQPKQRPRGRNLDDWDGFSGLLAALWCQAQGKWPQVWTANSWQLQAPQSCSITNAETWSLGDYIFKAQIVLFVSLPASMRPSVIPHTDNISYVHWQNKLHGSHPANQHYRGTLSFAKRCLGTS